MKLAASGAARMALPALLVFATLVATAAPEFDPATMMPVSEVQRGMTGIGKSVFQGTKIEEFGVEILGVLTAADLGGDVILARMTSGVPFDRDAGAVAGMSGSPIYIDGRLVGALALGWSFSKEPIFGITPIRQMLESLDRPKSLPEQTAESPRPPALLRDREITRARVASGTDPDAPAFADEKTIVLRPLSTLVSCSGFTREGMVQAGRVLARNGLQAAPGGGPMPGVDAELEPGAAIGVQLMSGDFDMTAVGTVTYRDGDSLIAFGHPLMQLGETDLPMTSAYIHDIVPGIQSSMKMASPLVVHGRLLQDRPWSVGGAIGEPPQMVPVSIRVRDGDRDVEKVYSVQVAQQESVTPELVMTALINALTAAYKPSGEGTASTSFVIETREGHRISRSNMAFSPVAGPIASIMEFTDALGLMAYNSYEKIHLSSVDFQTEINSRNTSAEIKRVYLEKPVIEPGQETTLHIFLKPFNAELVEKTIPIKVPTDVTGVLRVVVSGGAVAQFLGARMGVLTAIPETLDQELAQFAEVERGDCLVASTILPDAGIAVKGQKLERLPSSIASVMSFSQSSDMVAGRGELRQIVPTEYAVDGMAMVTLTVYEKGTKPPTAPAQPGAVAPPGGEGPPAGTPVESVEGGAEGDAVLSGSRWASSLADFTWDWSHPRPRRPLATWDAVSLPSDPLGHLRRLADTAKAPEKPEAEEGAEGEKPSGEDGEGAESEKQATPVARQPSTWTQASSADFLAGKLDNVAVIGKGRLTLAPAVTELYGAKEYYLWSMAAGPDGVVYAGTGNSGQILKITPSGDTVVIAETAEIAVSCLTLGPDGALYAGTTPGGKVLRIGTDGQVETIYDSPETYVWAIEFDGDGRLIAGTGSRGIIYRMAPAEPVGSFAAPDVLCDLDAPHALSLAVSSDTLFAGTGEKGIIYRIRDGQAEAIYQCDEDKTVNALVADDEGGVYAGTSPGGRIIKVDSRGAAKVLYDGTEEQVLCMRRASDGHIYAGTANEGLLLRVEEDDEVSTLWDADEGQILALADTVNGTIYVGTGNIGAAYAVDLGGGAEGEFRSAVCDAARLAQWGAVSWRGSIPEGAEMTIETRSGNTADPDSTWSAWSAAHARASGDPAGNPPGRFLQYRVRMKRGTASQSPEIERLSVVYLPANQKPTLTLSKPAVGGAIGKKCEFEWTTEDSDKDTLRVNISRSNDDGKTWETVAEGLSGTSYSWDASAVENGAYALRVQVSDAVSNPGHALTDETILHGMVLDTTPPTILLDGQPSISADGRVTIRGIAMDTASPIASLQSRVGESKDARAAAVADGIFDSGYEGFEFTSESLSNGAQTIYIDARDASGNLETKTVTITIETGKPKSDEGAPAETDSAE